MAKKFLVDLDLNQNELQKAVVENLSADPAAPVSGQIFYDTDDNRIKMYDGGTTSFKKLITEDDAGSASLAGLTDTNIATPTTGNILIYDGTDSWDNKAMSGDIAIDNAGVSTIQAGAVDYDMLATADITTDLGASATTTQIARADAIKSYVDSAVSTADALVLKGDLDCSTNPNYPAADKGDSYFVTIAGKIGGASGVSVNVGDMAVCKVDSSAGGTQAAVGANWFILESNRDQATETTLGLVELATQAEVNTGTDANRVVTPATLAGKLSASANKYTETIGDASATSIAVTHGLGSQFVTAQAFVASTGEMVECDITLTSATVTTFGFSSAPATDEIRVVIVG